MKTQVCGADRRHRNEEVGGRVKFNLKKKTIHMVGTRMKKAEMSTFEVFT